MYKRPYFAKILKRLQESRKFIQIISGARQTGKTTLIQQILQEIDIPSIYASADTIPITSNIWIEQQWAIAKVKYQKAEKKKGIILVFDEIQKIQNWSETVKLLWDKDNKEKINIKIVLLGSSPLLLQKGLTESLGGRFELNKLPHWSYTEMKEAFHISLEQYIYFGGYPGSISLIKDEARWKQYIRDSLIETTIAKDILMMTRIDKPSLLKQLFELGCLYSSQVLSFNKVIGHLQDAGNTTTLAHYLEILSQVGMITGLQKYSAKKVKERSSSPKFQVLNTALITAQMPLSFTEAKANPAQWGRLVESAIGAHLINITQDTNIKIFYWRERNREVDFILTKGKDIVAIEVKSGKKKEVLPGIALFAKIYAPKKVLLVGTGGMEIKDFLALAAEQII